MQGNTAFRLSVERGDPSRHIDTFWLPPSTKHWLPHTSNDKHWQLLRNTGGGRDDSLDRLLMWTGVMMTTCPHQLTSCQTTWQTMTQTTQTMTWQHIKQNFPNGWQNHGQQCVQMTSGLGWKLNTPSGCQMTICEIGAKSVHYTRWINQPCGGQLSALFAASQLTY